MKMIAGSITLVSFAHIEHWKSADEKQDDQDSKLGPVTQRNSASPTTTAAIGRRSTALSSFTPSKTASETLPMSVGARVSSTDMWSPTTSHLSSLNHSQRFWFFIAARRTAPPNYRWQTRAPHHDASVVHATKSGHCCTHSHCGAA